MSRRLDFIAWCLQQEGKPYVWDSKGPDTFDCSGLVTAGYLAVGLPDWRATHSSALLWSELPEIHYLQVGDLCFWDDPIDHVMVWWGDGRCFGASGGNKTTDSVMKAAQRGARVHFTHGIQYRPRFRGFRVSPFEQYEQLKLTTAPGGS